MGETSAVFLKDDFVNKRILIYLLVGIFAVVAFLGISGIVSEYELAFAHLINPNGNKNPIIMLITELGSAKMVILITALLLLLPISRKKIGAPVAVTVISSWLLNTLIKNIVCRPRPIELLLDETSYSFPSGHAMNNAALYFAIMVMVLKLCKTKKQRIIVISLCTITVFLIGISRVYFNVHYISDVVCGWCLGTALALLIPEKILHLIEKKG